MVRLAPTCQGPVTERMNGSRHPLQRTTRTRSNSAWRAAAAAFVDLRAQHTVEFRTVLSSMRLQLAAIRHRDEALIRGGFVHRFFVAMQEICAKRRVALVAALETEQQAAIHTHNDKMAGEIKAGIGQERAYLHARHRAERRAIRGGSPQNFTVRIPMPHPPRACRMESKIRRRAHL